MPPLLLLSAVPLLKKRVVVVVVPLLDKMSADEAKKRKALAPADSGMDYSSNDEDDDEDDCSDDDDMDLDDDDDDKGALEELRALPGALYAHARAAMAKLSRPNEHGFHSGVSLTAYRASLMSIKDALEKSRSVIFEAVEPSLKDMHEKYLKRANRDDGKVSDWQRERPAHIILHKSLSS